MMQTASTQQQAHGQDLSIRNNGFSSGIPPDRVMQPNAIPLGSAQPVTAQYDTQPYYTSGGFGDPLAAPFGRNSDMNGGSAIPGHGFNYSTGNPQRTRAPSPLYHGYMPYGYSGQGGTNHNGYQFTPDTLPSYATNFSYSPLGAHAAPNNQGPCALWQLFDSRVSYEGQNELHLTIVFKRIPSA
ncbi:hypothetical protein B0F90DRAFT_732393 [Multifurca ochricompacta]|uniref:Uncharacterized protein n=1 Tax=Multifurca ochricompacta TaxID=376703 RepID=A0AAD4M9Z4_9AGAM|nr:hypothetical protein B0F90DRAFT_732393 [Multifurca ochricompacta]